MVLFGAIGFRQDASHAAGFGGLDQSEALQAKRREQLLERLLTCDRPLGDQRQRPFHAGIDHEGAAGKLADRAYDRFQVGVDEIQNDRIVLPGAWGRSRDRVGAVGGQRSGQQRKRNNAHRRGGAQRVDPTG
jgi:hypothetical protein